MTTFRLDPTEGPGTHVFIIAVGKYPHLIGGTGKPVVSSAGMGQLKSPPLSGLAFLQWVDQELHNPQAPLKSIEVLISDVTPLTFSDSAGTTQEIAEATLSNVKKAAADWFARLDSHEENVAIFYFCGHGAGNGVVAQLMLSDYGSDPIPADHSISFHTFRLAMGSCRAKHQLYLVDACRVINSSMLVDPGALGNSLLPANVTRVFPGTNPALFSAKPGQKAFSPPGQISYFTSALISSLRSYGVYRSAGVWVVSANRLQLAIAALLRANPNKAECLGDGLAGTGFKIHQLKTQPKVILDVSLDEPKANSLALIRCEAGGATVDRMDMSHPWRTVVDKGPAVLSATFPHGTDYKDGIFEEQFDPPFEDVLIRVKK